MSSKRKAEDEVELQLERKARRPSPPGKFKGDLSRSGHSKVEQAALTVKPPMKRHEDTQAKEDTAGGGVWSTLFPDEEQSNHSRPQAEVETVITETSQVPGVHKWGPVGNERTRTGRLPTAYDVQSVVFVE